MEIEEDPAGALELSVSAAMARQHASDARSFLRSIAALLESMLPGEVVVQRAGLFGGDARPIRRLEVSFADELSPEHVDRYTIEDPGKGSLTATRTKVVRRIALKSESIPIANWIIAVGHGIALRASQNKAARDALATLL